jgi:hypothetical protein
MVAVVAVVTAVEQLNLSWYKRAVFQGRPPDTTSKDIFNAHLHDDIILRPYLVRLPFLPKSKSGFPCPPGEFLASITHRQIKEAAKAMKTRQRRQIGGGEC